MSILRNDPVVLSILRVKGPRTPNVSLQTGSQIEETPSDWFYTTRVITPMPILGTGWSFHARVQSVGSLVPGWVTVSLVHHTSCHGSLLLLV